MQESCIKCNGELEGLKCEMCGAESFLGEGHECGEEFLAPKCVICDRVQLVCNCCLE